MPDNLSDLRDWYAHRLPAAAAWNCEGFPVGWHIGQVRAGHRFIPSVFLPNYDAFPYNTQNENRRKLQVDAYAADLAWLSRNGLPLCIRTGNVCDGLTRSSRYRTGDPDLQPLVYRRILADAGWDQRPVCDPFSGKGPWETEGFLWGQSLWINTIGGYCPNPAWLMFAENNEGNYDDVKNYFRNGQWIPNVRQQSERMAAYLANNSSYAEAQTMFAIRRRDHYLALFNKLFRLSPWAAKVWYTVAYGGSLNLQAPTVPPDVFTVGYDPEGLCYDALSPKCYLNAGVGGLTGLHFGSQISNMIPQWEWSERRNSRAWREVSVSINGAGALAPVIFGLPVISPEIFEGWCGWLLWSLREPGVPFLLRHWIGSSTTPTTPFSDDQRLKGLTHADYILAVCRAVDRVCEHETLRKFWREGTPVLNRGTPAHPSDVLVMKLGGKPFVSGAEDRRWRALDCELNSPRSDWKFDMLTGPDGVKRNGVAGTMQVWACATEFEGRWLVYAFAHGDLPTEVVITIPDAGRVALPAPRPWGYYLVQPAGLRAEKLAP